MSHTVCDYYTTIPCRPLLLILQHDPNDPVCSTLWKQARRGQVRKSCLSSFELSLTDPVSERLQTITIQSVSGLPLMGDWDTSYRPQSIDDSGHPCNTSRPPCLGNKRSREEVHDSDQPPAASPTPRWQNLLFWRPRAGSNSQKREAEKCLKDTEINEIALLRSSALIAPDQRAYRVTISCHHRRESSGEGTLFLVTFLFGRCVNGNNLLEFRCQEGDTRGLLFTIE